MSRILIAWELGAGYGHLDAFPVLAQALRERGHDLTFVLRDLTRAEAVLGQHELVLLQAPLAPPLAKRIPRAANFAELIQHFGWRDASLLCGLVKSWRELYRLAKPDLLVLHHAPTALLASAGMNLPRVQFGTGFGCPPVINPMPNMLPWEKVSQRRLIESEGQVLNTANEVLHSLGVAQLDALAELFRVEETLLCTFEEMDVFRDARKEPRYWGPRLATPLGTAPAWPSVGDARIFAYVKMSYHAIKPLIEQLGRSGHRVLAHVPGIPDEAVRHYETANLAFARERVNLGEIYAQCDLAICHGGHGTTTGMLLAGSPVLLIPEQVEQFLNARRVVDGGLGRVVPPVEKKPDLARLVKRMLGDQRLQKNVHAFAEKYADFNEANQIAGLTGRMEASIT